MFLILEGEGDLRFGDRRYPLRRHDVIACPPGGPSVTHPIINTGTTTTGAADLPARPCSSDGIGACEHFP